MGILDNAGSLINRGVASAGRGTKSLTLKAQIADLEKRRGELTSELGAKLFEETRSNATFRDAHEGLYASIETLDEQRNGLRAELANLEQQAQLASPNRRTKTCPTCGRQSSADDVFCAGCGANLATVEVNNDQPLNTVPCSQCGYALKRDDSFCMNCGAKVEAPRENMESVSYENAFQPEVPQQAYYEDPPQSEAPQVMPFENVPQPEVSQATQYERVFQPDVTQVMDRYEQADGNEAQPISEYEQFAADQTLPIQDFTQDPVGAAAGICQSCGYENSDQAVFCRNCGQKISG